MLSEHHFALIKQSLPLLANAGVAVTEHFYTRLFSEQPELKHIFNLSNQASGKQQFALFAAIARFATYLDTPERLAQLTAQIANKHVALQIKPEHYPIVGANLLATLRTLFPAEFTPEVEAAWANAYGIIADLLITAEAGKYQQMQNQMGGWYGLRTFYIADMIEESAHVKSFYLKPLDGKAVANYVSGQFITVSVHIPNTEYRQQRHYTLSGRIHNGYRISVKNDGLVSAYLHQCPLGTELQLAPPAGDFTLRANQKPKVLISGGVGITPMVAMLEELITQASPVWFLHACQNAQQHSFKHWLVEQQALNNTLICKTWYEEGDGADFSGRMDIDAIALPLTEADFYLCGPEAFMRGIYHQLIAAQVSPNQIYYEMFGPHSDLSA
ncbi:NO-inducible flavohemoprotein [Pseudoalteromonas fenneropenaei]|uniref:nitric oxide dioxygenase n=1 Tax=Pseudoalteromonas fenneropenaei TaxID=1737459 RepID=A0ABV7CJP1_9GAMM